MFNHISAVLLGVALIVPPPSPESPAEGYLVALRPSPTLAAADVGPLAADLVGRHGGRIKSTFRLVLKGFAARMTPAQAHRMAADPRVARIEPDTMVSVAGTQTNAPWHLDRIDQRALPLSTTYTYPNTGAGVNVYVLDTGIRTTHQEFGGRARHGRDTVDDDGDATDCHGHGTHVAGIAGGSTYGVAKGVTLHAVRVIPCTGTGPKSDVIEGIEWVTANAVRPAVVNMSLRGEASDIEDAAIRASIAAGLTYVAGAGNDTANACGYSPGRMPEVLTVGNTTSSDARYSSSNTGSCLDVFAPGTNVKSAWHDNDTATFTATGTSMATPMVTGAVALELAADPGATPAQLHAAIVGCATPGLVSGAGTGSPNRLLHVNCGALENPTDVPIPDWGTATSPITVSRGGNAPVVLTVSVKVVHPYRGDLALDLVAPDGTVYPLKPAQIADLADNVDASYTVDASAELAAGEWRLRARDTVGFDTGHVDWWRLGL
ncbi:S8 family serine peptidase [Longispora sp. NPDC051575]|uniref:S8 family peptidase n=1 Tax=Longispora sp. NPDC051575 TaxID=3154943 RepID=UPI0034364D50